MQGIHASLCALLGEQAAGFTAGLFPASKAAHAPLFPVVDKDGVAKPAILVSVEELVAAGLEEVIVVIQKTDEGLYRKLFHEPLPPQNYHKLSGAQKRMAKNILRVGKHVRLVVQDKQDGFGHAVYCARKAVGDETPVARSSWLLYMRS